jgi:serine/threonine protein kinase
MRNAALSSGDRLGPYQVVGPLGSGGMGEVYRARDTRLGRDVAVKVLSAHGWRERERRQRFDEEVRAVAALSHSNVLTLHDVGSQGDVPYAVFELLEGRTLGALLVGGPLPVRKAVDYGVQICHGLAAAHARGIVHRDLKPENVFLTRDGQVKILDFGLARQAPLGAAALDRHSQARTPTRPGSPIGTFGYMSPEQARGRTADARSDIFSAGAVLYEMLSGRPAFAGPTPADTLAALLTRDPPRISGTPWPVPAALERVVRRCLERNPEERFQAAADLAFALQAVADAGTERRKPEPAAAVALPVALLALAGITLLARSRGVRQGRAA